MRSFVTRYNYFLLLILIFGVSEIIVNPLGDFPLNDDWSYGKAVYYLSLYDDYTIGAFSAMTLFTHLVWGSMFVKVFGFSFTVLRMSTIISAMLGLFFLDKIIVNITKNKLIGFLACLVLLFNPLYFNLANTFMTDVNFNSLLVVCCYFAFEFFQTRKRLYFFLFFVAACLLVLLRQFGIIMPVCFTLACLLLKEKKWLAVACSLAGTVLVYLALKRYESYLAGILPSWSSYKFSGNIHFFDKEFWNLFKWNVSQRYKIVLLHLLVYSAPIALVYLGALIKDLKKQNVIVTVFLSFGIVYWLFNDAEFPFQNIFTNMSLGPETFYESLHAKTNHTYSESFKHILQGIKFCFSGITVMSLVLCMISLAKKESHSFRWKPEVLFLLAVFFTYALMIFITESYFDRYHIPFISVLLVLFAWIGKDLKTDYRLALLPLICFFYVSVFGTKDYLCWNRLRWEAYEYLRENKNATAPKVNGGFELNCLNDMDENWWYDYATLQPFDYLIQFKKEDGFRLLKEYEFQRYFPYKKDKINIFVKEDKEKTSIPDK